MKGVYLSSKEYFPNKENEGWERELIQQEPNPIVIFYFEEKT